MSHHFLKKLDANGNTLALPLLFLIMTGHQTGQMPNTGWYFTLPYLLLIAYVGVMALRPWRRRENPQPAVNQQKTSTKSLLQAGLTVTLFCYAVTGPIALLRWTQFHDGIAMPYIVFAILVVGGFLLLTYLQPDADQEDESPDIKVSLKPNSPIRLASILTALLIIAATPISETPRLTDTIFMWVMAGLALAMGQTATQAKTEGTKENDSVSTTQ